MLGVFSALAWKTHRAPTSALKAASLGGTGAEGVSGSATDTRDPAFWRFVSDAILMRETGCRELNYCSRNAIEVGGLMLLTRSIDGG